MLIPILSWIRYAHSYIENHLAGAGGLRLEDQGLPKVTHNEIVCMSTQKYGPQGSVGLAPR